MIVSRAFDRVIFQVDEVVDSCGVSGCFSDAMVFVRIQQALPGVLGTTTP